MAFEEGGPSIDEQVRRRMPIFSEGGELPNIKSGNIARRLVYNHAGQIETLLTRLHNGELGEQLSGGKKVGEVYEETRLALQYLGIEVATEVKNGRERVVINKDDDLVKQYETQFSVELIDLSNEWESVRFRELDLGGGTKQMYAVFETSQRYFQGEVEKAAKQAGRWPSRVTGMFGLFQEYITGASDTPASWLVPVDLDEGRLVEEFGEKGAKRLLKKGVKGLTREELAKMGVDGARINGLTGVATKIEESSAMAYGNHGFTGDRYAAEEYDWVKMVARQRPDAIVVLTSNMASEDTRQKLLKGLTAGSGEADLITQEDEAAQILDFVDSNGMWKYARTKGKVLIIEGHSMGARAAKRVAEKIQERVEETPPELYKDAVVASIQKEFDQARTRFNNFVEIRKREIAGHRQELDRLYDRQGEAQKNIREVEEEVKWLASLGEGVDQRHERVRWLQMRTINLQREINGAMEKWRAEEKRYEQKMVQASSTVGEVLDLNVAVIPDSPADPGTETPLTESWVTPLLVAAEVVPEVLPPAKPIVEAISRGVLEVTNQYQTSAERHAANLAGRYPKRRQRQGLGAEQKMSRAQVERLNRFSGKYFVTIAKGDGTLDYDTQVAYARDNGEKGLIFHFKAADHFIWDSREYQTAMQEWYQMALDLSPGEWRSVMRILRSKMNGFEPMIPRGVALADGLHKVGSREEQMQEGDNFVKAVQCGARRDLLELFGDDLNDPRFNMVMKAINKNLHRMSFGS